MKSVFSRLMYMILNITTATYEIERPRVDGFSVKILFLE